MKDVVTRALRCKMTPLVKRSVGGSQFGAPPKPGNRTLLSFTDQLSWLELQITAQVVEDLFWYLTVILPDFCAVSSIGVTCTLIRVRGQLPYCPNPFNITLPGLWQASFQTPIATPFLNNIKNAGILSKSLAFGNCLYKKCNSVEIDTLCWLQLPFAVTQGGKS